MAAIFTVPSGLALAACTFAPALLLESNWDVVRDISLGSADDGSLYIVAGILIAGSVLLDTWLIVGRSSGDRGWSVSKLESDVSVERMLAIDGA